MKKLISLFSSVLVAALFTVAPVNAVENDQSMSPLIYAACEGAGSAAPLDIINCNGRR